MMGDVRSEKSIETIKKALLRLLLAKRLEDISMSELAREAGVSRSTLYAHFGNVPDVYAVLVLDVLRGMRPLATHLHCSDCVESGTRPFCAVVREAGDYEPVVRDARFLPLMFDMVDQGILPSNAVNLYAQLGMSRMQADALFRFQISGCYAVALSDVSAGEWDVVQRTLDAFIRGGVSAVRVPIA
ncbi:MAG: TetR/AcrR family transcriptional regulator [Eggerthellaceae bacterium]|nr:TetR/AcrR family transcriptional regulator [Eggerthellaceae bacterium]